MSEEPFEENIINEIENDDDNEQDTLLKQELIAFVKANPALYTKNWKEYAGKDFCKDLAWENIGFNLSKQVSGKDAAKMWYSICQRFGKERRKVVASLKGRSGQETKPLYVPKWQFYNLCLFLVDHITPRRTTSNYSSNKMKKTIEETSSSPIFILPSSLPSPSLSARSIPSPQAVSPQILSAQVLSPRALSPEVTSPRLLSSQIVFPQVLSPRAPSLQVLSPRATSPQILSVQAPYSRTSSPQVPSSQASSPQASVLLSPSSIWSTSDLELVISDNSASAYSAEENKENEALHAPTSSSSSLNVEECSASASKDVLKTMRKISSSTERIIPEPDNFAKLKRKDDDLLMQAINKQSTALISFTTKFGNSLMTSNKRSTPSSASSVIDPVLAAIGYALNSVLEEKRLECMMEVLQLIKSKYIQK
ncbi:uncharacterized protein LOC120357282 [Solenopsis invicta]|uniref:uncharacterized protein LOC120357282 n=1 Tax=Solenopsis invicta TaxID=13686 RepID=UPI00193E7C4C|nr:uncharacterized protein LOC120357282 [Solenopsis invicta]